MKKEHGKENYSIETVVFVVLQDIMSIVLIPFAVIASIYLSYFFELSVYKSLFQEIDFKIPLLGFTTTMLLAVTTNAAKLAITYILEYKRGSESSWRCWLLRTALIVNSLLMTVFIVNTLFTSPYVKEVLANKRTELLGRFYERQKTAERNHDKAIYQLDASYELEVKRIRELYQPELERAAARMSAEMENVQGGVWRGSRYLEWKEKYDIAKKNLDLALSRAMKNYRKSVASENANIKNQQDKIAVEKQAALAGESIEKYLDSYESQNRYVINLIDLIHRVSGTSTVEACHIILFVALLITIIVEFTPLLLGAHLFRRILLKKSTDEKTEEIRRESTVFSAKGR